MTVTSDGVDVPDESRGPLDHLAGSESGTGSSLERDAEPVAPTPAESAPPTEVVQTLARRDWTRGLLALAASFLLLIALGMAAVTIGDRLHAPESVSVRERIEAAPDAQRATAAVDTGGTAAADWSVSLGEAVLATDGVDAASADETYEVWLVRDGIFTSAGRFDTDASGAATVLLDGEIAEGDVITVTVEPAGGSSSGEPTSDPIVTIPTE